MIFSLPRFFLRFPAVKSVDVSHFHGDINPVLQAISRSGLALDSLDVSGNTTNLTLDGLRELGSTMRNLRVLRYSDAGFLSDDDLVVIADCFSSLQELDISLSDKLLYMTSTSTVTDFGIKKLATQLKDLRKVNLSGNRSITDASLFSLCDNCEFLSEITIQNCDETTLAGISSAIRQRPTLTSISVGAVGDYIFYKANINSDFVNSLMILKGLTVIDLSASTVSDDLLCALAEQGFPLKKLILDTCKQYTYTGLSYLLSKYQSVQYLGLQYSTLTDNHVTNLSRFLPNLTFINLTGCFDLTNSTFFTLVRRCPFLNEIVMEQTHLGFEVEPKVGLIDFGVNSQIKTLHLGNNGSLRNKDVKRFALVCPNLEYLDLSCCLDISARCVARVVKTCSKLRHLNLAGYSLMSRFIDLKSHFLLPNLEVLNLSRTRIWDESLIVISNTCCGLTHLILQHCFNVTEDGVYQVALKCTTLREIDLEHCDNVEADIVWWMVNSRPSLRKIVAPPRYVHSMIKKKLFLGHGCLVVRTSDLEL